MPLTTEQQQALSAIPSTEIYGLHREQAQRNTELDKKITALKEKLSAAQNQEKINLEPGFINAINRNFFHPNKVERESRQVIDIQERIKAHEALKGIADNEWNNEAIQFKKDNIALGAPLNQSKKGQNPGYKRMEAITFRDGGEEVQDLAKTIQSRYDKKLRWADYTAGGRCQVKKITVDEKTGNVKIPYEVTKNKISPGNITVGPNGSISCDKKMLTSILQSRHETKQFACAIVGAYKLTQEPCKKGESLAPMNVGAISDPYLRRKVVAECKNAKPKIGVFYGGPLGEERRKADKHRPKLTELFDKTFGKLGRLLGLPALGISRAGVFRDKVKEDGKTVQVARGQRL